MRMNKLLIVLFLMLPLTVVATEPQAINIHTNKGVLSEKIADVHYIHFSDDNQTLVLTKASGNKQAVPIADIRKITFGKQEVTKLTNPDLQPAQVVFTLAQAQEIHVDCTDGIKGLCLYNISGQQVFTAQYTDTPKHIAFSVAHLSQGVYVATVQTNTAAVSQKLTIH